MVQEGGGFVLGFVWVLLVFEQVVVVVVGRISVVSVVSVVLGLLSFVLAFGQPLEPVVFGIGLQKLAFEEVSVESTLLLLAFELSE